MLPEYESLDLFYLGTEKRRPDEEDDDALLLYKNARFTTHAAIIGMTGSGKTGLGIGILEEAVLDDIPLLVIDPKGDMGNLALAFKGLDPEDMEPWMDAGEAQSRGITTLELAREKAALWKQGLERSHQGPERLARYADKADITIYTPGSSSGVSVNVLGSFAAPPAEILGDADTFAALLHASVTGLLSLIGEGDADDGTDPAYLLLANLLRHFWLQNTDIDMEGLIGAIVNPPFSKLGLLDLSVVYPQKARLKLAMKLNGVIASPTFASWTRGEPLDVGRMLYTPEGKPRVGIFYLAHLNDEQRMFFVTMLLGRTVEWMRTRSGSSRLRALLYMDEVFGYFPPSKTTPAKASMMLLLKQARAFGVGVVLSTQNPVDLDYRALSNIGTWFIGRLQTERDRDKVLQGIGGDAAQKKELDALIANLPGRTFVLRSAKEDRPLLFSTRWVLSYLKGPMSKNDIRRLTQTRDKPAQTQAKPPKQIKTAVSAAAGKPLLTLPVGEAYLDTTPPPQTAHFSPALFAHARYRFFNAAKGIDIRKEAMFFLDIRDSDAPHWEEADRLDRAPALQKSAKTDADYAALPAWLTRLRTPSRIEKALRDHLYATQTLPLPRCPSLKLEARPDEREEAFIARVRNELQKRFEEKADILEARYAKKERILEERYRRLQAKLEKEKADVSSAATDSLLSFGMALFDLFSGSSRVSTRASGGIRKGKRAYDQRRDVADVEARMEELQERIRLLQEEYAQKVAGLKEKYAFENHPLQTRLLKPRKSDIVVRELTLVWQA